MNDPRYCRHTDRVPVDVLIDGRVETVAQLCLDCTVQLHPGFGCERCEWEQITERRLGYTLAVVYDILTAPCQEHA